jgi:hypothetical protein
MSNEKKELLPCPFCNGEVDPEGWQSYDCRGPECSDCGATTGSINDWNIRATQAASEDHRQLLVQIREWMAHCRTLSPYGFQKERVAFMDDIKRALEAKRGTPTELLKAQSVNIKEAKINQLEQDKIELKLTIKNQEDTIKVLRDAYTSLSKREGVSFLAL